MTIVPIERPDLVASPHSRLTSRLAGWAGFVLAAGLTAFFASKVSVVAAGETLRWTVDWVPTLGYQLSFYVDGLSLLFALLISGIGAFIFLYTPVYLSAYRHASRLVVVLILFMLSMLGLVLADDMIALFVFWELTTITSYILIGFDHDDVKARRCALQALLVTGAGGLVMLAGFVLLGSAAGTFQLSELKAQGFHLAEHAAYLPILILILIGAFTKSAQLPFHFWLPNAMAAPTPISAYLHSATMVKGGVYLLARMHPVLGGTPEWAWILTITGAATAVVASVLALRQTDLKLALAYTTVMALGTLTMFLGAEAGVAIAAAVTFLLVHALYKCALFLVVGIIDHGTGTRDAPRLGGLARAMPITTAAAAAAALSMAGFPPFLGFIGKELKYEGALAIASEPGLAITAAVAANAMMVAVAAIVGLRPFFARPVATPKTPHEAPFRMWIGPITLAALGLFFGLVPPLVANGLVQPAVTAVLGAPQVVKLALWHGINLPLLLSVVTLILGILVYVRHLQIRDGLAAFEARLPTDSDRLYDRSLDILKTFAAWQTRLIQSGVLRRYLFVVFAVVVLAVGGTLLMKDGLRLPQAWPDVPLPVWGMTALVLAGAVLTVLAKSRLFAICALGSVGFGVALIFLMYGAPDVAMTQLLVEILFVIIIAVVLLRLPRFGKVTTSGGASRWPDGVLAVGTGLVTAALILAATQGPIDREITAYFEANSATQAYGRNIVNVILVDFRALDTLGEILVVAVAAFAVVGLVKLRPRRRRAS